MFDISAVPELKDKTSVFGVETYEGTIEGTGKTLTISHSNKRVNVEIDGSIVYSTTDLDGKERLTVADKYYLSEEIEILLADHGLKCPQCGYTIKKSYNALLNSEGPSDG